jgi:type IX secretion system PorP/SprF family membrane protein
MRGFLFLALSALLFFQDAFAQDPQFSQFYANPMYLNPAFAGTARGPRFALNYRNQWPTVGDAFITYAGSYDQHFDAIGGGIGLQVYRDQAGDASLSQTYVSGAYSYHLTVKDEPNDYFVIKAGLQAAAFQRSIDFSKLRFGDQIDPRLGFIFPTNENLPNNNGLTTTGFIPDFSAGLMGFSKRFFGGFAVHHIVQPGISFLENPESFLYRKLTVHGGMTLPLDKSRRDPETYISPNIMYQRQGRFTQVNFGAYLVKRFFVTGLWFRQTDPNTDAMVALIGFKKDPVKIGYSYDLTLSGARYAAAGSHEVSLIVEIKNKRSRPSRLWKKINCPSF